MSRYSDAVLRWVLVPLAALGGMAIGLVLATIGGALLRLIVAEQRLEAVVPLDARVGVAGGTAAFGCVVAASVAAPAGKRIVSLLVFALGAVVAWELLGWWFFPESHPRAYQPSRLPLVGTCLGGMLGVVLVWLNTRQRH